MTGESSTFNSDIDNPHKINVWRETLQHVDFMLLILRA